MPVWAQVLLASIPVIGLIVGGGGVPKIVETVAKWRTRRDEADAGIVEQSLDLVKGEREHTDRIVVSLVECRELLSSERAKYDAKATEQDKKIASLTDALAAERHARAEERLEWAQERVTMQREIDLMRSALEGAGLIPARVTRIGLVTKPLARGRSEKD